MNNINLGRVLLGGLIAGAVINIGEWLFNGVLFKQQMVEMFAKLNVSPPGGSFIAIAVLMTFVLGIVIVLLYALIRPGCGPGPKTAICAALIVWFCVCLYPGILNGVIFGIPVNLILVGMVWCLIEYSLGAIAGAWAYKEIKAA